MFSVDFKINGRSVRPNQIGSALGQAARVTAQGRSSDKLNFQVSGCGSELVEQVKQKLR